MRSLQFLSIALLWCSTTLSVAQLELGPLPATVWCSGTTMEIPYAATGTFNAGNTFIMEISDASGSFTPAIPIGSLSGTAAGVITCTMNDLSAGTGHFVRVRSTDPPLTSDPSATTLTWSLRMLVWMALYPSAPAALWSTFSATCPELRLEECGPTLTVRAPLQE